MNSREEAFRMGREAYSAGEEAANAIFAGIDPTQRDWFWRGYDLEQIKRSRA
jgi:hypothetical protein